MNGQRWRALIAAGLMAALAGQIAIYAGIAWSNRGVWRMQDLLSAAMCVSERSQVQR
jgi:hypothetical protein